MAGEVSGVDLAAAPGVLYGGAAENTGAAKAEKTFHAGTGLSAQDITHGVAKLGIANEQDEETAQVVAEQPFITIRLRFEAGDIEVLRNHGVQTALSQVGLATDQAVVASDFACIAKRAAIATVKIRELFEGEVFKGETSADIER